jgi:hypothetical protein
MAWQGAVTAVVVAACSAYAVWNVMPAALRRRLAAWAGRPLPAGGGGGCGSGCDGCGPAPVGTPLPGRVPGEAVIRVVRPPPR